MEKKNYTLEDIDNYLKELGFVWLDKLVYNPDTRRYRMAKPSNFNKDIFLLLKRGKYDVLMLATISNSLFELRTDCNKMNASAGWIEFLEEKNKQQEI